MYQGFRTPHRKADGELERIAGDLANAVIRMWDDPEKRRIYCQNAKAHGENTHNREKNYARLIEIYTAMTAGKEGRQAERRGVNGGTG